MRSIIIELLITALVLTATLSYGATADHVGIVKAMAGEVVITRNDHTMKAAPNMKLREGDIVQTGPDGKAGLILEDDTVISMGFNTRIAIKSFLFQPNDKKLSLIARIFQGTVSFVSGQIARLAPHLVHIETPTATVGLRGTHVLIQVD
ncbi:MAG: FecR domain-containing protein [Desulfuromonadales bacterium]|nr:FecR domain-containing protein [Desulfuromonadales bacterium]